MGFEKLGIQAVAAGVPGFVSDLGRMQGAISKTSGAAQRMASDFVGVGDTVLKAAAGLGTAIVGAAGAAGGALFKLAADAAPLAGVRTAFEATSERIGKSGDEMLAALQKASGGMIDNRRLMLEFNKSAALISDDFAARLPDAFGLLAKASLATGQSLDWMLQSYTLGVGRLSPMIIDNLAIQVKATEAYEEFAEANGLVASELTKTQQQMALNEAVIAKLEEKYGALGDVGDTTVGKLGSLGTMFSNLKDELGLALLPAFGTLIDTLTGMLNDVLPRFLEYFRDKIVPVIEVVTFQFANWVKHVRDGTNPIMAFALLIDNMYGTHLRETVGKTISKLSELIEKFKEFYTEHKDEIIAAAKAIAGALGGAAMVAAIMRLTTLLARLTSPIGLLITFIGLLAAAWEGDWLGIRTTLTDFWENVGQPIFEEISTWLEEKIPQAVQIAKSFWEQRLQPIFDKAQTWLKRLSGGMDEFGIAFLPALLRIREFVQPIIETFRSWFATVSEEGPSALAELIAFFQPIIEGVQAIIDAVRENWPAVQEAFARVSNFIKETVGPTFSTVVENIRDALEAAVKIVGKLLKKIAAFWSKHGDKIMETVSNAFNFILGIIEIVLTTGSGLVAAILQLIAGDFEGFLDTLTRTGENLKNLWWRVWDSLRQTVVNIWDGIVGFVRNGLARLVEMLEPALDFAEWLGMPVGGIRSLGEALTSGPGTFASIPIMPEATSPEVTNYNLTVNTSTPVEPVISDFNMMRALGGLIP